MDIIPGGYHFTVPNPTRRDKKWSNWIIQPQISRHVSKRHMFVNGACSTWISSLEFFSKFPFCPSTISPFLQSSPLHQVSQPQALSATLTPLLSSLRLSLPPPLSLSLSLSSSLHHFLPLAPRSWMRTQGNPQPWLFARLLAQKVWFLLSSLWVVSTIDASFFSSCSFNDVSSMPFWVL